MVDADVPCPERLLFDRVAKKVCLGRPEEGCEDAEHHSQAAINAHLLFREVRDSFIARVHLFLV